MDKSDSELKVITFCLVILAFIAAGFTLSYLKPVLAPFTLALLIVFGLRPFVKTMEVRLKAPHWVALTATLILAIGLLLAIGSIITSSVQEIANNKEAYQEQIGQLAGKVEAMIPENLLPSNMDDPESGALLKLPIDSIKGVIGGFVGGMFGFLSNGFLVLIFTLFLLPGQTSRSLSGDGVWTQASRSIENYLVLKTVISIATGAIHGFILWILGVKFAFAFGVIAALANFIPSFGPVIAVMLPIPALPMSPDINIVTGILALALPAIVHVISGNVVETKLIGSSLDLSPVALLLSLIFFGMIWGVVGMFLATPLTVAIKIAMERYEQTAPFAQMLAGRFEEKLDTNDAKA